MISVIFLHFNPFFTPYRVLPTLFKTPFENIVEKGENSGYQHFLLFPLCFLPFSKPYFKFQVYLQGDLSVILHLNDILKPQWRSKVSNRGVKKHLNRNHTVLKYRKNFCGMTIVGGYCEICVNLVPGKK